MVIGTTTVSPARDSEFPREIRKLSAAKIDVLISSDAIMNVINPDSSTLNLFID